MGALLCAPGASAVTPAESELLTTMVANAASADPRVDVVTMADLQKVVTLAANRQYVDCDATEACLAEVAAALDAVAVVHGKIGELGSQVVLNLSLLDTTTTTALGRASATGRDLGDLADRIGGAVVQLLAKLPTKAPTPTPATTTTTPTTTTTTPTTTTTTTETTTARIRVLVMEMEVAGARAARAEADASTTTTTPTGPAPWSRWQTWTGIGALSVGALAVVGAVVAGGSARGADQAGDDEQLALKASDHYRERDVWVGWLLASSGTAAVGLVGGGVLLANGWTE
jgi:hypothetical protein